MTFKLLIVMLLTMPMLAIAQPTTAPTSANGPTSRPAQQGFRPRPRPNMGARIRTTAPATGPVTRPAVRFVQRAMVTAIDDQSITVSTQRAGQDPSEQTFMLAIGTRVAFGGEQGTAPPAPGDRRRTISSRSPATIADVKVGQPVNLMVGGNDLRAIFIMTDPPATQPKKE